MRRLRPASALAAALALLVAACGDDDDQSADTTTSSETTARSDTTDTTTTTTTDPSGEGQSALTFASDEGVAVVEADGDRTSVSDEPAAVALALRSDLVVFQGAVDTEHGYPPRPDGPVEVWSAGEVRELPMGPDARRAALLDVAIIDDAPVALVSERIGEADPEDTFEELVFIDLDDDTRTTAVRRPAWESGYIAASVLPDGAIIGLMAAEASLVLNRWSPGVDDVDWTVDLGIDVNASLAVRDGEVSVVESSFDQDRGLAPVLTVTAHDPETGDPGERRVVDVSDPDGTIETGLFCGSWLTPAELLCARSGGPPVAVSVDDGSFQELPGPAGAVPASINAGR